MLEGTLLEELAPSEEVPTVEEPVPELVLAATELLPPVMLNCWDWARIVLGS